MTSYLKSESHPSGDNTYQPVVAYFNSPPPFIDAPTNLNVTGVQAGRISLSWIGPASGGVDHYQIERSTNISGSFTFLTNVSGAVTFYNDDTVSNQHSYLYRVRSVTSGGAVSAPSNMAMGTAIAFEFANLQGQEIRKQHFYDVRTAVNAVRTAANLSLASWAPRDDLTGLEVKTDDVQQIRTALDAALQALGIPVTAYEDSTLTSDTLIRAIHLEQLQTRSTRGSSNGSGSLESDSSTARLDPMNETGGGGENPLSRNFNWNLPLLNLPGRAGMDLSLTLSYNSLVWNKIGTGAIAFDEDNGFPGPGFRLGFPVIQPLYANSQTGKDAFLLIGPDGSRTELRQVGSLPLYESADSSHLLLDATTMILRSTDGTQLSYALQGAEYKCAQIKDRNGNYITATYTVAGQINTITDTLGRAITFNYANGWLTDITQVWNPSPASPHYWARFEYEDKLIDTNFPGKTVYGPADQTYIKTLTKVKLADDSYFKFDYTSWGQAFKVSAYAPNNDLLNYRKYNLPETGSLAHDDCPRFTERRDWAKYWNGDTEGTSAESEEALTQFAIPADTSWTMPGESSPVSGMRAQVTAPDGTSNKIYFLGEFGWQRDLPALVDTYASGVTNPVRRAKTTWTQDDPTVSYPLNPRVTETNIYDDASNRARTVITYQQFEFSNETSCHLPEVVKEYAADASTILRSTKTLYKMDEDYTDERILGLVSDKYVYDGDVSGTLAARVGYFYDQSGSLSGNDAPVQHDHTNLDGNTNYNSSFLIRGNLSSVKRYDITDTNFLTTTTTSTSYNTAGAVVSATDAASHTVTISYGDSFSDGVSRNTLAYATTTTDAAGYFSKFKYNFAFGALTYRQTPPPNYTGAPSLQPAGPEQTFEYYEDGRLKKQLNEENDAYTRYIYGPNYVESWGTVNTSADEAHSLQIFDGAGRVIATAMNHPGSTGGFSGIITTYDAMGRPVQRSNPAETSISIPEPAASINPFAWQPTGDDAQWVYTMQTYDWKGRPRVTTNPSMTGNPADTTSKETSYSGCGCAGGEVVTLTDEVGRRLKVFSDVLGREWKKEILNWDGSVYSTSVSVFNGRDQVTNVKRYAGTAPVDASSTNAEASCPSGTCQETLLTYDGYGRLQSKHVPQQNAGTTTTYSYNSDDTLNTTTDARGALTTYVYNSRHMTTSVVSTLSGSPTIAVTHGYDAAGNRTSMSQTSGGVAHDNTTYSYDQLSRMTSETIHIDQIENYSPNYGSYTIGYEYNLSNQLTSVVDPFSTATSITYDQVGRTATVTGSWNGTNYTYANNVTYRAWGGLKSATVGGANKAITYNNRMLPSHFGGAGMSIDYTYHNDGKLNTFKDLADQIGDPHDVQFHYMSRAYSYDHAGRISGVGQLPNYSVLPPFSGSYGYDAFDNLTSRTGSYALNPSQTDTASYTNNRRGGWSYNAEGQITSSSDTSDSGGSSTRSWTYDAAGRSIFVSELRNGQTTTTAMGYDGDGELITELVNGSTADYFVRSSVLGTVLTKLKLTGGKDVTYVPANGLVYPMQMQDQAFSTPSSYMRWVHHDPSGVQESNNGFLSAYDPFGGLISNVQPPVGGPPPYTPFYGATYGGVTWNSFINANNFSAGCLLDGRPTDCNRVQFALQNNPFVQLDPNHSLPWTASGANQTSQLPFGIREEWRLVQPGQRAPQGAKTRSGYFGEFILYAHYSFFGGGNLFPDPQNPYDPRADFRDYAVSLANNTSITDCNKLALLIYKAGQAFGGNKPAENGGRAIVDGLMAGLTEYTRVTLGGRQGPSDPNFRVGVFGRDRYFAGGFHDSGFDVRFRDAGGNQVRHFIFYFGAGFGIGEWAANHGLYDAEGTKSGRNPDVALGWEGTKRGARFDGNYKALAQDVWRHVCGQSTTLNLP
jgi:YD repeat-containing protein